MSDEDDRQEEARNRWRPAPEDRGQAAEADHKDEPNEAQDGGE